MARPVLHTERAKGPGQRVAAFIVDEDIERFETRPLGQKIAAADAMADRRVAALQEGDGRGDGGQITLELLVKTTQGSRTFFGRHDFHPLVHLAQACRRKQFQHQLERDVVLCCFNSPRSQKAGQIGRRRIGRVELRHRRDDGKNAERAGRHGQSVQGFSSFSASTAVIRNKSVSSCWSISIKPSYSAKLRRSWQSARTRHSAAGKSRVWARLWKTR